MSKPSQAKMKDVAERAGVSLMAVSLALRGDQAANRISVQTRERILQIARELSYSPNARGRVLRSGVTNVIGMYAGHGFVNVRLPYFTEVVSGLQDGCDEFGKDLLLHGSFRNRSADEIFSELRDGRIDGLIVSMPADDPLAGLLVDSHLPVIGIADALPHIPSVIVDDAEGGRLIAQHLAARGHKSCLYLNSGSSPLSSVRRRHGFLASAQHHGLAVEEIHPYPAPNTAQIMMKEWLDRNKATRPTAIVCWNDSAAYEVLAQCRNLKIDVPNDVAVTGFDGCPTQYEPVQTLTTIRAPWSKVAQVAVEQLNSLIAGESVPDETVLPIELLLGETS